MQQMVIRVLIVVLVAGAPVLAAPHLMIRDTLFKFGAVPQVSKVSRVFWLVSDGKDTLRINRVIPGCGCTQVPVDKTVLPPGDSTRLEVIFDTKHYTGVVSKRPLIETNDGTPGHNVSIECEVMVRPDSTYPIISRPFKVDLSQFGKKVRDKMKYTITNVSDKPITMALVSSPSILTIDVPPSVDPGKSVDGLVTINPDALETEFEKSFTIELDGSPAHRFTIPVKRSLHFPGDTTAVSAPSKSAGGH